jgi:transcriptional regulator with XRE-family HTH domain
MTMEDLKRARLARGWTQAMLAVRAGVNLNSVSAWERGRITPSKRTIERLRAALEGE